MEDWVIPFMREPVLWPIWVAILGHAVLAVALALLATWRGEGVVGIALVTLVSVGFAGWELKLFRAPGPVNLSVLGTWLLALPTAWLGAQTGFI